MTEPLPLHVVEQGSGPLVLFVHGFPETSYSWRHQMAALADAGYRAAAIDVRGYGRSPAPKEIEAYRMLELVADNVATVEALGAESAVIVGHDWGSPIAATSALLHPDVFTAVCLMSVPYAPPGGPRPTEQFAKIGGEEEFYISFFQEPGRAEAEIDEDRAAWLRGIYVSLSGEAEIAPPGPFFIAPGTRMADRFADTTTLPDWLREEDLAVYTEEFERTGLTGGLNRYRNMDRDWEDLAAHQGAAITQPSLFVGGEHDASLGWMAAAVDRHAETLPNLRGTHILEGAGHWVQQERPTEVNRILLDWLQGL